jgi:hypothetical protein
MESIPSNLNNGDELSPAANKLFFQQPHQAVDRMMSSAVVYGNNLNSNNYQKFGTVGGYVQHSRPAIDMQHTFSGMSESTVANEAAAAAQALANSRLRAVNRSFRTAVDKSFDNQQSTVQPPPSHTIPANINRTGKFILGFFFFFNFFTPTSNTFEWGWCCLPDLFLFGKKNSLIVEKF